ncbi:unnamed protein product, partial [Amoebophrya sp. A120]
NQNVIASSAIRLIYDSLHKFRRVFFNSVGGSRHRILVSLPRKIDAHQHVARAEGKGSARGQSRCKRNHHGAHV